MQISIGKFKMGWDSAKADAGALTRLDVARASLRHGPEWVFDLPGQGGSGAGVVGALQVAGAGRPAEHTVMVFGCLTARTEAIGGVRARLTDGEGETVAAGPAQRLLERPNGAQTWGQYIRTCEAHLTLYNALTVAVVDGEGAPELVPLSPGCVEPVPGIHLPTGTPRAVAWDYRDPETGLSRRFQPDEMLVHCGYNPHAPLAALSPLKVLARTIRGELAAREQNLALYQNGSTPRGVLQTDKPLTKQQADEVREKWEDTHRGQEQAHRLAVLWGGLTYQSLGLSPVDMDFLAGLRFLKGDYYMAFRVCPAMVWDLIGETGLSQGSSTDSQKQAWWEDVGMPELQLLAEIHQPVFSRLAGAPVELWFDDNTIPALVRARLAKLGQFKELLAAGYRPDEANEFLDLGLPPHPDNQARVAFGLAEIGQRSREPARVDAREAEASAGRVEVAGLISRIESSLEAVARAEQAAAETARQENEARRIIQPGAAERKAVAALEGRAAKKWSRFFIEQRGRILRRFEAVSRTDALARAVGADGDSLAFSVFPRAEEDAALVFRLSPVVVSALQNGWEGFARQTGIANPFEVEQPEIQEAIQKRLIQCKKVNDTTEEDLRLLFAQGFQEGETVAQLTDRVAEYYAAHCEGADSARASTAAATQTTGIVNDAQMLAAEKAGGLLKFWIAAEDEATRPAHAAAALAYGPDKAIALNESFVVGGEKMNAPGDPTASAANVCNCRCAVGFVRRDKL